MNFKKSFRDAIKQLKELYLYHGTKHGSQVLVDWGDNEIWHGRLFIELIYSLPNGV